MRKILITPVLLVVLTACNQTPAPVQQAEPIAVSSSSSEDIPLSEADCEQYEKQYDPPSTVVTYEGDDEITFTTGYSPSWNWEPFTDAEGTILFGQPRMDYTAFAGCSESVDFWYGTIEPRTAEEANNYYESEYAVDPNNVTVHDNGRIQFVVMENVQGVCPAPILEVMGKTKNHVFSMTCAAVRELEDPTLELEKIAESIRLKD